MTAAGSSSLRCRSLRRSGQAIVARCRHRCAARHRRRLPRRDLARARPANVAARRHHHQLRHECQARARLRRSSATCGGAQRRRPQRALCRVRRCRRLLPFSGDTYPKIVGGEMWIAMDPPSGDGLAPQDGILNIRDFAVRGEAALERVATGAAAPGSGPGARRASNSRACASSSPARSVASPSARAS